MTRHADIDKSISKWYTRSIKPRRDEIDKQTFTDNMKACGYELSFGRNGNITATKGDNTVRLVPLADYGVYISTPSLKAITSKDATDTETLLPINLLTA